MVRRHYGDAAHGKRFLHIERKSVQQFENVLGSQQPLAQTEKPLHFAAALFRAFRLATGAFRQVAGHQRRHQKSEQCHPILRIGNSERSDRRQKEKIEGCRGAHCHHYGIAQSPVGRGQQHRHQEHQRDGRVIDVQLEVYGGDHADCGDHECIAYRLRPKPGFHIRIVRWR